MKAPRGASHPGLVLQFLGTVPFITAEKGGVARGDRAEVSVADVDAQGSGLRED